MNTAENNKLIAEFLGGYQYDNHDDFITFDETNNIFSNDTISLKNLKFHTDWNWLMEVVEKIESLGYSTELKFIAGLGNTMFFISGGAEVPLNRRIFKTKIEAVYNACVTFIEWYNEQPK